MMLCEHKRALSMRVSVIGLLSSLALHALLITPLVLGFSGNTNRPATHAVGIVDKINDQQSPYMTLIFIADLDPAMNTQAGDTINANARLAASPPMETVTFSTPSPNFRFQAGDDIDANHETPTDSSQLDPALRLLFGRYIGQIASRIERAWMRPRTPIGSTFECRVQITQDRGGVVQEIELVRCNGNHRWQMSLVHAIQSASPLPAPPDADVYVDRVIVDLQSAAFTPGDSGEGFEPEARATAIEESAGK